MGLKTVLGLFLGFDQGASAAWLIWCPSQNRIRLIQPRELKEDVVGSLHDPEVGTTSRRSEAALSQTGSDKSAIHRNVKTSSLSDGHWRVRCYSKQAFGTNTPLYRRGLLTIRQEALVGFTRYGLTMGMKQS